MVRLDDYQQFVGRHWETGSVANYLAYRGVTAPHTDRPYSEALLTGISGGAVMGYFSFAYEGYDPHVRILTRNTFDPMDTMLARMGIVQHLQHTGQQAKGLRNLLDTLEEGVPSIVWADMYSLPYNALPFDEGMWAMFPVVVFGYDEEKEVVWLADRARVPLTVTMEELAAARARVKKFKFRVLSLDPPLPEKLTAAVRAGIWDCIRLYTEKPPKGSKNNFGLAAFRWWAQQLTNPRARQSWEKIFPAGREMFAGLTSTFTDINIFGKEGYAERNLFADFLDEASLILERPVFNEVAIQFRDSALAWEALSEALLPDSVSPFKETRELLHRQHQLFLDEGNAALPEIKEINQRLEEIKADVAADFPLDAGGVVALREEIADHVTRVHDIEAATVTRLREVMG